MMVVMVSMHLPVVMMCVSLMVDCTTDIAVSAPFDEGGKVFIYYGSKETGINSTVQQASVLVKSKVVLTVLHVDNHS